MTRGRDLTPPLPLPPCRQSLCSAITPVKVEFAPDGPGVPAGMFARKWLAHFSGEELELVQKAAPRGR